jgi:DNA-directed RNA polymerase specialized sigma subunit
MTLAKSKGSVATLKSSLIETTTLKRDPDINKSKKMLNGYGNIKERNALIVKAYEQSYSQHLIAKALGISQPVVYGMVKRSRK